MPARQRTGLSAKPKRRSTPYPFILEALAPLEPEVRPMFSGFAVYVADKMVLMLRDSLKHPEDNGVWLVFSETADLSDRGSVETFLQFVSLDCSAAKSVIGDSSLPTPRPLSPKPCSPASFSSNTTCGSDASHSL